MAHDWSASRVDERSSTGMRDALMCTCDTRGGVDGSRGGASDVPSSREQSDGQAKSQAEHA